MNYKNFTFHCCHCETRLDSDLGIKLKITTGNKQQAAIFINPEIGNYTYQLYPKIAINRNELVNFSCPRCLSSIKSDRCELYSKLKLHVDDFIKFDVLFSNICGDHRTHLVTEDDMYLSGNELHEHIINEFSTKMF